MEDHTVSTAEARRREKRGETYDWLQCMVSALLICILVFVFVARGIGVLGSSMYPTLQGGMETAGRALAGDRLLVSNLFYTPKQGDIIVLRKSSFKIEPIVKRVIAVGGQTVDIDFDAGIVYVDGAALPEAYTNEPTTRRLDFVGPLTVPEHCVFVMGDNRNYSTDSRDSRIGVIDERFIIGKAYFLVLPGENTQTLKRDFSRLGLLH